MPVTRSVRVLGAALVACALGGIPGCSVFEPKGPSSVAQGKYYASGNAQYDQFFITLFDLQVALADAPAVPERERAALAQAVGLSAQSPSKAITEHLKDEAQKLLRAGVRVRLEQSPVADDPQKSAVSVHSTSPPPAAGKDLLAKVEASTTNLLRVFTQMIKNQETLRKLEVDALSLEANVDPTFLSKGLFKRDEVRKNLTDAERVITLMKARCEDVRNESSRLLASVEQAVTTDDSAGRPPPPPAPEEEPKAKPAPHRGNAGPARPKAPSAPKAGGDDAPAPPPPPPTKAPPAPKDFEP
jgi:hypothetical protein